MKRNISFGGMALLDAEGAIVEDGGLDIDQQHGDGADAALLEVQDTNAEVVANDAAVGELENTAMALESLLESAENSIETGGLDPLSAEILTKAVNNETAPLGTDAEEVVPALESFRSSTDRRQATVMAVESVKGWIEKVWAKIKELIQKGRDLFKKLVIKIKQAVQRLEARVKGIKAAAEARNESAKKPGNLELGARASAFTADAKSANDVKVCLDLIFTTYADDATKLATDIAGALTQGDEKKAADVAETSAEDSKKKEAVKYSVPKALESVAKIDQAAIKAGYGKTADDGVVFPGGYVLTAASVGFAFQMAPGADAVLKTKFKETATPISLKEITDVCDILLGLAKQVTEFEKNFQKRDEAARKVVDAGDKFAKEAKKDDKKDEGDVRAAINAAKEAAAYLNAPLKSALTYAVTYINGTCDYLAKHVAAYDKK